ncbi:dual specificity protein phosphatase 19-like, partial [Seriola lalandi dorsalis]
MQSLTEEIQSFSRTRLRKQCTRVTSLSGRRIIETWKGSTITVVEDPAPPEKMLGYVPDTSWDLQVGVVKPYLLL